VEDLKSRFGSNSSTRLSANALRSLASIVGVIDPASELMTKTRFASLAEAVLNLLSTLPTVACGRRLRSAWAAEILIARRLSLQTIAPLSPRRTDRTARGRGSDFG